MPSSTSQVPTRPLGKDGPHVSRLGLGLMSLSGVYGVPASDDERLDFLDQVFERGERFWVSRGFSLRCLIEMVHG